MWLKILHVSVTLSLVFLDFRYCLKCLTLLPYLYMWTATPQLFLASDIVCRHPDGLKRVLKRFLWQLSRDGNLHGILRGTQEVRRRLGQHRKCWMDNIKKWTSLPMRELLRRAFCRKAWKGISAESSLMSPDDSQRPRGWTLSRVLLCYLGMGTKRRLFLNQNPCNIQIYIYIYLTVQSPLLHFAQSLHLGVVCAKWGVGGGDLADFTFLLCD